MSATCSVRCGVLGKACISRVGGEASRSRPRGLTYTGKRSNGATLNDEQLDELADVMIFGVAEPVADKITGKAYAPFEPLPCWVAADWMGIRRVRTRTAITNPRFRRAFASKLDAVRNTERARNLYAAVRIRDQELAAETAADRGVKLRAIASIEGRDATELNVTLNQTNNLGVIAPGYVIRLPANAPLGEPITIDATPVTDRET